MVKYESQLDAVFMALAHPARRAMLARLGKGEATVGELAQPLDMSVGADAKLTQGADFYCPIAKV